MLLAGLVLGACHTRARGRLLLLLLMVPAVLGSTAGAMRGGTRGGLTRSRRGDTGRAVVARGGAIPLLLLLIGGLGLVLALSERRHSTLGLCAEEAADGARLGHEVNWEILLAEFRGA